MLISSVSSDLLPPPINTEARQARELRRRMYLVSLALIVPVALVTTQAAFPNAGYLRSLCLAITAGWALLFIGLLFRWISNFVVEWGTYLLGALVFFLVLVNTLQNWDDFHGLAFLGAASLMPSWAFFALREKWGLRVSLAYYGLLVVAWLYFAVPAWLAGTYQTSQLAQAWKTYVYYYALTPVYIVLTASMAIMHRYQAQQRLKAVTEYVYQDPLTGLPNRRAFQERLEYAVAHAIQTGEGGTLLLLNINGFTRLNNELGHTSGDTTLRTLTQRWQATLKSNLHLSRVSGDEFALILPSQQPKVIEGVVKQVLAATEAPIELGGALRTLSVRLGLVAFPQYGQTATAVNRAADVAQAEARRQAQEVTVYNADLAALAERRRSILRALPEATALNQMSLVYQPILELATGRLESVEALLCWNSPVNPNPSPDEFIALAEEARLIVPLGTWVMDEALHQMTIWHKRGVHVPVINVNVAPQELLSAGYAQRLLAKLQTLQLSPDSLKLELTERTVLESAAVNELWILRQAGVNVAIDDFGTGHSSLAWLHSLPINGVKIDRRFTKMLGQDSAADRLSRTVLNLANSLNLQVVAEGVETPEQLRLLQALNCPLGQGYLFSKPLSAEAFEAFWQKNLGGSAF